jgi:hypothetical protein
MDSLLSSEPGESADGSPQPEVEDPQGLGLSIDSPHIHIKSITVTDKVAADYLEMVKPEDRPRAFQLMVEIGSYALTVGTRQVAEIDLKKAVAEALQVSISDLEKALNSDADERERRLTAAIVRQREKLILTPALAGGDFEDFVEQLLRTMIPEDVVDRTSRTAGVDGDAGDISVESSGGVRVVIECKRGYPDGMSNARMNAELSRAKTNRQAEAGILVLDSVSSLGGHRFRKLSDVTYAVVVGMDEEEDGLSLMCALSLVKSAVSVGRGGKTDMAALAQHANALQQAVRQHDELLTTFNELSGGVSHGKRLVEDARHAVQAAALRLAELSKDAGSGAQVFQKPTRNK